MGLFTLSHPRVPAHMPHPLKVALKGVVDFFLPPRCPATGRLVLENGTIDPRFWADLSFIHKPYCACCGLPFSVAADDGALCAACLTDRPVFARARGALRYDDVSASLVLRFKYADTTLLAPVFATWIAAAGADILAECDMIVPVPLHRVRLLWRRYNQAALLGAALAKKTGLPHRPMVLVRHKRTEVQGKKSRAARLDNVRGVFHVPDNQKGDIKNKRIILVDDVLTSGATVSSCARALLAAGAASVDVLCVARVTHADS
jgi:ComF family protein